MTILKFSLTAIFLVTCLFWSKSSHSASENLYKFVDENGVLHLSNFVSDKRYRHIFPEKKALKKVDGRTKARIHKIIERASYLFAIDSALIKAVVKAESDFNPYAVSYSGAKGLMQLMPETAADLRVSNPFDPTQNIFGGVRHLKKLLKLFGGDLKLSLAAYNAGRSSVLKYGGIPPYKQTEEYVVKVMHYFNQYKEIAKRKRG